jgi:hypothetical protein
VSPGGSAVSAIAGTLSLVVPGAGSIVRGRFAPGLFYLSAAGCLAATAWALVETMERIADTLRVLGYPGAAGIWALGAVIATFVLLHLASILDPDPYAGSRAPHPAVASIASAIVPGWGQMLAGCPGRAAAFVFALWVVAAAWALDAPAAVAWLDAMGMYLPPPVEMATSPVVRWTAPAVVWAVAVYDAGATAARR